MTKSIIYLSEKIPNTKRIGNESVAYYQAFVVTNQGEKRLAFFTTHDVTEAIRRASKNPEDHPRELKASWLRRFLNYFSS